VQRASKQSLCDRMVKTLKKAKAKVTKNAVVVSAQSHLDLLQSELKLEEIRQKMLDDAKDLVEE
jgi:predicted GNAT family N-acyltransferase